MQNRSKSQTEALVSGYIDLEGLNTVRLCKAFVILSCSVAHVPEVSREQAEIPSTNLAFQQENKKSLHLHVPGGSVTPTNGIQIACLLSLFFFFFTHL